MPECLQDTDKASAFRADYDALLSQAISPATFFEFHEHAHNNAMDVVLAATVYAILGREIDEVTDQTGKGSQLPKNRRHHLRRAGEIALQIETLDARLRDKDKPEDLVLYGQEKLDKRGDFTGMYLTTTDDSYIEHVGRMAEGTRAENFYLVVRPKFGVEADHVISGKAEEWLQGSYRHFEKGVDSRRSPMGLEGISIPYKTIDKGAYWYDAAEVPSITMGRDAILEYFEKLLEGDLEYGYSENRWRRPSFSLFRMAHYLGDVVAEDMFKMGSSKGIVDRWKDQMIDDEAMGAVLKFRAFQQNGLNFEEEESKMCGVFTSLLSLNFKDAEWLKLTKQEVVERALKHAQTLGVDMTLGDVHRVIDITMDYRHQRQWD